MVLEVVSLIKVFPLLEGTHQSLQEQSKSDWDGFKELDKKSKWKKSNMGRWQQRNRLEDGSIEDWK